jgi:hydrogenase maturation protease
VTAAPVVICLGNDLRGDDGAGLEVARLLRPLLPAHVALLESDGDPAEIVDAWAGAPLAVVVDAVVSGAPPGTVHHQAGLDARAGSRPSSHALGLADAIALGRALGRLPADLACYGIEAADLTLGRPLSPAVRAAARSVAEAVAERVTGAVAGDAAHPRAAAPPPAGTRDPARRARGGQAHRAGAGRTELGACPSE